MCLVCPLFQEMSKKTKMSKNKNVHFKKKEKIQQKEKIQHIITTIKSFANMVTILIF